MNLEKEIFLPDTTLKLKSLKSNLSDVYDLEIISKKTKYFLIGGILVLGSIVLYQYLKVK